MKNSTLKLALLLIVAGASFSCSHSTSTNSSSVTSDAVSGAYIAQTACTYRITLNPVLTPSGNSDSEWTGTIVTTTYSQNDSEQYWVPSGKITAGIYGPGNSYGSVLIIFDYEPNDPAEYNSWESQSWVISLDTLTGYFVGTALTNGYGPGGEGWTGQKQ